MNTKNTKLIKKKPSAVTGVGSYYMISFII